MYVTSFAAVFWNFFIFHVTLFWMPFIIRHPISDVIYCYPILKLIYRSIFYLKNVSFQSYFLRTYSLTGQVSPAGHHLTENRIEGRSVVLFPGTCPGISESPPALCSCHLAAPTVLHSGWAKKPYKSWFFRSMTLISITFWCTMKGACSKKAF